MASRGVHCLLPGRKVAACADGPDVQNSSGWPCQCVFLSWPDHLLWPHSGWYIVTVPVGCLWCLGADGLPLSSPASPCGAAGASVPAVAPAVAEHSRNAGGADHIVANRTSGLRPSPAVPYGSVGIVPARTGYGLLAFYGY